uniref:Uncharacterized protein n=1 Tax=Anguilla anguilla TaxID=7936 RepID=A0A0E9UU95_ANGAN
MLHLNYAAHTATCKQPLANTCKMNMNRFSILLQAEYSPSTT